MPVPPTRGQHETLRPPPPLAFDRMSQSMDKNGQTHPLEADEKTRLLRLALRDTISGQATNCFAISVSAGEYGRAQLSKASSLTSRQAIAVERDSNAHFSIQEVPQEYGPTVDTVGYSRGRE